MYFLAYAYVFHGIMKFKFLKFSNLNISRTKITFDIKEKTILLISKVLILELKNKIVKMYWAQPLKLLVSSCWA